MTILRISSKTAIEVIRKTLSDVYGLSVSDYEIIESNDPSYMNIEIYSVPDILIENVVVFSTDTDQYIGYITVYPQLTNLYPEPFDYMINLLNESGICYNVDYDVIRSAYDGYVNKELILERVVARGKKAIHGKNAEITIHFDELNRRPAIDDLGRVDYKTVDLFAIAEKGDILLTKKPATDGTYGITVRDERINQHNGTDVDIVIGDGVALNEAGMAYVSTMSGYIHFDSKKITVSEVYVVDNNVDYTTGNISFNGLVHVRGDVIPGFKVYGEGGIIVDGICQDAELISKGNIVLRTGIKSRGNSLIMADGDISFGYAENVKIYSKRNIIIKKYAYNCELYAGERIIANSAEGIIAGGVVRAFSEVSVKHLGSPGNSKFSVILGSKYFIEEEVAMIRKEKLRLIDAIEKIVLAVKRAELSQPDNAGHHKIGKLLEMKVSFSSLVDNLDKKEKGLLSDNIVRDAKLKVKNKAFDGVKVVFHNSSYTLKEEMNRVVFYFDHKYNEVAWVNIKDMAAIEDNGEDK